MTKIIKSIEDVQDINFDNLVCVVTHKRKEFIAKWLRAWNNADKFGAKIVVFHSIDKKHTNLQIERNNILSHNPDYYFPFENSKARDLAALILACKYLNWEKLFWFTDDMLPMRRSFLKPFVEKIQDPRVGLVAQCYEPRSIGNKKDHIRTVAYAIKKEVSKKIVFPYSYLDSPAHEFESGENNILQQIKNMGYDFKLAHSEAESENYLHWTSFLDWMWDCHLLGSWEDYWDVYEQQFDPIEKWENIETSNKTLLNEYECEKITNIPNKITAIIPTYSCDMSNFMLCVFSLLLRSSPEILEHIIVGINGPDERTGGTELQDNKQKFIEELRKMTWFGKMMPITLSRTWSRLGHAQMIEQCLAWVHTEYYLLMHDDVMILDKKWNKEASSFFLNKNSVMKSQDALSEWSLFKVDKRIVFPHFTNTNFLLCSKNIMKKLGADWVGYHVDLNYQVDNLTSYKKLIEYWKDKKMLKPDHNIKKEDKFDSMSLDIGSFILPKILDSKYDVEYFSKDCTSHMTAGSWMNSEGSFSLSEISRLEKELKDHPEYEDLYLKYA